MTNTTKNHKLQHRRSAELRHYLPLVRKIAGKLRKRLSANVEMDDLVQNGLIGLNDALRRFERGHSSSFETYAARRIEGEILDALREEDTLPRRARTQLRKVRTVVHRLEQSLGRAPRAKEVANALGWSLEKFHRCMVEARVGGMRAGDDRLEHAEDAFIGVPDDAVTRVDVAEHTDPVAALEQRERHAVLSAAFDALEEVERYVMESIYDRSLTLKDVGKALGITESRVSQIRAGIVAKLRTRLQGA